MNTVMKFRHKFNELTMLELFYSNPVDSSPQNGRWCYEATDSLGITLRFSVYAIQEIVQLELKLSEHIPSYRAEFEMVDGIEIIDLEKGSFAFEVAPISGKEFKTRVQIELRPVIKIEESALRISYDRPDRFN